MSKEDVYYNHSEVPTYICTKWSADPKGGPATPEHTIYVGPGQGIDVTVLGWSKINPKCVETESSELIEDAKRYRRLRILGAAPYGTKHLEDGTVIRFTGLDAYLDEDIKRQSSRGEAEVHECEVTIRDSIKVMSAPGALSSADCEVKK